MNILFGNGSGTPLKQRLNLSVMNVGNRHGSGKSVMVRIIPLNFLMIHLMSIENVRRVADEKL
jgi:hypothetical protein